MKAMQCIASCITFPRTPPHEYTYMYAYTIFLSCLITYTDSGTYLPTHTFPRHTCTEAQTHLRKRNWKRFSLGETKGAEPGI